MATFTSSVSGGVWRPPPSSWMTIWCFRGACLGCGGRSCWSCARSADCSWFTCRPVTRELCFFFVLWPREREGTTRGPREEERHPHTNTTPTNHNQSPRYTIPPRMLHFVYNVSDQDANISIAFDTVSLCGCRHVSGMATR
jgi:hypothetical protein